MNRLSITLCAVMLALAPPSSGQTLNPPDRSQHSSHKQEGFFDFVMGKINPNGDDYGAKFQSTRDAVVQDTVDDLYFWSNALTLLLLTGSVAVILLQWRSEAKRETITAAIIAELWNGRVSDRIELDRRTLQFNELVSAHNAEVEKALVLKQQQPGADKQTSANLSQSVRKLTVNDASTERKTVSPEPSAVEVTNARSAISNSGSLQQSNLLLQRRIEALQNTEQNLKQRLNQTTALLDQERRRNASLKGA